MLLQVIEKSGKALIGIQDKFIVLGVLFVSCFKDFPLEKTVRGFSMTCYPSPWNLPMNSLLGLYGSCGGRK